MIREKTQPEPISSNEQQKKNTRTREQHMNDIYIIQQQRMDTQFGNLTRQENTKRNKTIGNYIDWNERRW